MKKNSKIFVITSLLLIGAVFLPTILMANCIDWHGNSWCEDSTCNLARNYNEFISYFYMYNCDNELLCDLYNFNYNLGERVFGGYFVRDDLLFMYTFPYTRFSNNCELLNSNGGIESTTNCARVKLYRADFEGGYGTYIWEVYIPKPELKSQFSIGMFLYHDDSHEIDFECGYGKRSWWEEWWQDNKIYCYMTSQGNPEDRGDFDKIQEGWHTFKLKLIPKNGKYFVYWIIDGSIVKELQLEYGDEKRFKLYFSTENLAFIGDEFPHKINWAAFWNVDYVPIHNPTNNSPGNSCGSEMVYDCVGNCVSQTTAQSWIGDGYCDDGTYGIVLTCSAFNYDGGDCNY